MEVTEWWHHGECKVFGERSESPLTFPEERGQATAGKATWRHSGFGQDAEAGARGSPGHSCVAVPMEMRAGQSGWLGLDCTNTPCRFWGMGMFSSCRVWYPVLEWFREWLYWFVAWEIRRWLGLQTKDWLVYIWKACS